MKERPILFSAPMVRAILDGRKTQTRRIIKDYEDYGFVNFNSYGDSCFSKKINASSNSYCKTLEHKEIKIVKNKYGKPGDHLWVRETFMHNGGSYCYKADYSDELNRTVKYKPSIHMPRVASRIDLLIKDIRVEKVLEISEGDAEAEGAEPVLVPPDGGSCPHYEGFKMLWQKINGAESWNSNPWVWVISFERIKP